MHTYLLYKHDGVFSVPVRLFIHTIIGYCLIYHTHYHGLSPHKPLCHCSSIYTGASVYTTMDYCPIYHAHYHRSSPHTPFCHCSSIYIGASLYKTMDYCPTHHTGFEITACHTLVKMLDSVHFWVTIANSDNCRRTSLLISRNITS